MFNSSSENETSIFVTVLNTFCETIDCSNLPVALLLI